MRYLKSISFALGVLVLSATIAQSETRVTYKSAKSTSSYYQMAVQIAEALKIGSNGGIMITVEESQGSRLEGSTARTGVRPHQRRAHRWRNRGCT